MSLIKIKLHISLKHLKFFQDIEFNFVTILYENYVLIKNHRQLSYGRIVCSI